MTCNTHSFAHKLANRRVTGLGLIEQMVAMLIGLFLVIGATSMYLSSRKSSAVDDAVAQLQLKAHKAIQKIEADVRMANYWGLSKDGATIINKPEQQNATNPSAALLNDTAAANCGSLFAINVERYIEATNNAFDLPETCAASTRAAPSSDMLTVRRAAKAATTIDRTKLQVCSQRSRAEIILGSPCTSEIHDLKVNTYYVDQQSGEGAGYPSLRRKSLDRNPAGTGPGFQDVELVAGVEDMQVQLGWDPTGKTASAVQYFDPGTSAFTDGQVVTVRLWLLIRSQVPDKAYTNTQTYSYGDRVYTPHDHFRRLLVSRTLFVRNAVGT